TARGAIDAILTAMFEQMRRTPLVLPPPPAPVPSRQSGQATAQPAAAAPPGGLTRSKFESVMARQFSVTDVHKGTLQEPNDRLTRPRGTPAGPPISPANWRAWDPGPSSPVYQTIVDSFTDFETTFGGIPPVNEIVFFEVHYDVDPSTGALIRGTDVGASYG